jgi:casein kinase 1
MDNIINRKFKINDAIGNGKFGIVYKGQNLRTKEIVAIKTEKNSIYKLLKREAIIIDHLYREKVKKIPSIYWYGKYNDLTCLIMTHFQYDLMSYVEIKKPEKEKIGLLIIKCIDVLENVHNKSIIHRDIKPQNFMIKDTDIYLIDFGLALFYKDENNIHIQHKDENSIVGTPKYISFFNHNGELQSRRDDLISLGYMYLFLISGSLPWDYIHQMEYKTDLQEISLDHPKNILRCEKKEFNNLREHCDENLLKYLDYCYSLNFDDDPDYDKLMSFFTFV